MHRDVLVYLDAIPDKRRQRFMAIHELILHVDISSKMPTYKVSDNWVALANQQHRISLYTCSRPHIDAYKHRHPERKSGKGCINFQARDEVDYDALAPQNRPA